MTVQDAPRAAEFLPIVEERLPPKIFRHVVSVAELILSIREEAGIEQMTRDVHSRLQGKAAKSFTNQLNALIQSSL